MTDYLFRKDGAVWLEVPGDLHIKQGENKQIIFDRNFWDDLRFPAQGINPPGAASDPTVDTTDGCLVFSASAENIIGVVVQMPHDWKAGSSISPHIHWSPSNTDNKNCRWKISYQIAQINGAFPGTWTEETITQAAAGVADTHQLAEFTDISMAGYTLSCILKILITRLGNDGADTFTGTAKLLEFDLHYQRDGFGSAQEYAK